MSRGLKENVAFTWGLNASEDTAAPYVNMCNKEPGDGRLGIEIGVRSREVRDGTSSAFLWKFTLDPTGDMDSHGLSTRVIPRRALR